MSLQNMQVSSLFMQKFPVHLQKDMAFQATSGPVTFASLFVADS